MLWRKIRSLIRSLHFCHFAQLLQTYLKFIIHVHLQWSFEIFEYKYPMWRENICSSRINRFRSGTFQSGSKLPQMYQRWAMARLYFICRRSRSFCCVSLPHVSMSVCLCFSVCLSVHLYWMEWLGKRQTVQSYVGLVIIFSQRVVMKTGLDTKIKSVTLQWLCLLRNILSTTCNLIQAKGTFEEKGTWKAGCSFYVLCTPPKL